MFTPCDLQATSHWDTADLWVVPALSWSIKAFMDNWDNQAIYHLSANEVLLKTYYTDLIHQEADGPRKEMKLTIACAII